MKRLQALSDILCPSSPLSLSLLVSSLLRTSYKDSIYILHITCLYMYITHIGAKPLSLNQHWSSGAVSGPYSRPLGREDHVALRGTAAHLLRLGDKSSWNLGCWACSNFTAVIQYALDMTRKDTRRIWVPIDAYTLLESELS